MLKKQIAILIICPLIGIYLAFYLKKLQYESNTNKIIQESLVNCSKTSNNYNFEKCTEGLKIAFARNSIDASYHLGTVYEDVNNLEEAINWYKISSNMGHIQSKSKLASNVFREFEANMRFKENKPNQDDWAIVDDFSNCLIPHKCIIKVSMRWRFSEKYISEIYNQVFKDRHRTKMDIIEFVLSCMSSKDNWPYLYILSYSANGMTEPFYEDDSYKVNNCSDYSIALSKHIEKRKHTIVDISIEDAFMLCGNHVKSLFKLNTYGLYGQYAPKLLKVSQDRIFVQISINVSSDMLALEGKWKNIKCSTPKSMSKYQLIDNTQQADIRLH